MGNRHVEYVEEQESGRTPVGGFRKTPTVIWSGVADLRPLSAREVISGAQQESQITHRLTMRWHPGIRSVGHFRTVGHDAQRYEITSVLNQGGTNRLITALLVEVEGS